MSDKKLTPKQIKVTCKGADTLPIDRIIEFQGQLKTLSDENMDKLKKSILKYGFSVPFFVWENEGDYKLLDGHQRLKTLLQMRIDGYNMPMLPVAYIEAKNEKEAKRKLLHITSQYGKFNKTELGEWIDSLGVKTAETIRLTDKEIDINKYNEEIDFDDIGETRIETVKYMCPKCGFTWEK